MMNSMADTAPFEKPRKEQDASSVAQPAHPAMSELSEDEEPDEEAALLHDYGSTDYHSSILCRWDAFRMTTKTVWVNPQLWWMIFRLTVVAMLSTLPIMMLKNPEALSVRQFVQVSKILNVFVGLLLGFFLTSSMNRWYTALSSFLGLLDSIRNIQLQMIAFGVPEREMCVVLRYAYVSAWLLYESLMLDTKRLSTKHTMEEEAEAMWQRLMGKRALITRGEYATSLLTAEEVRILRKTHDPPCRVWVWVSALIGRLAQDGWIPGMNSPTYGRVMNLVQACNASIQQVRASIAVQSPLAYTQCLAVLVHVNNIMNAVTLGLVVSIAALTFMRFEHEPATAPNAQAHHLKVVKDMQELFIICLYCTIGPLLYQALLIIAMQLAQPFDAGAKETRMPMDRYMEQLEADLCDSRYLVDNLHFEQPHWKAPDPAANPPSQPAGRSRRASVF